MAGIWGNNIKLSIFGESHGEAIGIVIDGLKPGIELNIDEIKFEMQRRAPGRSSISTSRNERDNPEILSGYFNGKTTGTPLCTIFRNSDKHSNDYSSMKDIARPGHADYTGFIKYKGYNDYRGGGHFSGRITAPLVFAGAIAKQILSNRGIYIGAHIQRIGSIEDTKFNPVDINMEEIMELRKMELPLLNKTLEGSIKREILRAKEEKDSVGGIIECATIGINAGIGEPFFDSVESKISHIMFSIPAIKGIEFGDGFELTERRGSYVNDSFYIENDVIKTKTNHNGGILGGITNAMPIVFRVAVKPTPSISKEQETVNFSEGINTQLSITGRHDPCIVQRALPVVEAATALAILDLIGEVD